MRVLSSQDKTLEDRRTVTTKGGFDRCHSQQLRAINFLKTLRVLVCGECVKMTDDESFCHDDKILSLYFIYSTLAENNLGDILRIEVPKHFNLNVMANDAFFKQIAIALY